METSNKQTDETAAQLGVVDYVAALRQYNRYGRGRSMKKFCEDEGYDYWKFCKLAREGQIELESKSGADIHRADPVGEHLEGRVHVRSGGVSAADVAEHRADAGGEL